ncbi:MAG: NAD(P)H-dependent oxidoreductase [Salibacteraceae bacterium]
MSIIDNLKWRYATKKFDSSKKISTNDLNAIKEAISLTATSYGLESYKVLVVENPEIRAKLVPASWGQTQISDASHLLVFCNFNEVTPDHIDALVQLKANTQGIPVENLTGYGDFMKKTISGMPADVVKGWTARQTYIALGNAMAACAELKIDSCPMEGFDASQYNKILGLDAKGLNASVVLPIGYRSEEDQTQHGKKVRKPLNEMFEVV